MFFFSIIHLLQKRIEYKLIKTMTNLRAIFCIILKIPQKSGKKGKFLTGISLFCKMVKKFTICGRNCTKHKNIRYFAKQLKFSSFCNLTVAISQIGGHHFAKRLRFSPFRKLTVAISRFGEVDRHFAKQLVISQNGGRLCRFAKWLVIS